RRIMRRKIVVSILQLSIILMCLTELSVGQSALNNDSIIQMVSWQISDSEIIAAIDRASKTNFDFSPANLNVLRTKHVSAAVLQAMFDATVVPSTSGATAIPLAVKPHTAAADNGNVPATPPRSRSTPAAKTPPPSTPVVHIPVGVQSPQGCLM